jgi:hypothetical protein
MHRTIVRQSPMGKYCESTAAECKATSNFSTSPRSLGLVACSMTMCGIMDLSIVKQRTCALPRDFATRSLATVKLGISAQRVSAMLTDIDNSICAVACRIIQAQSKLGLLGGLSETWLSAYRHCRNGAPGWEKKWDGGGQRRECVAAGRFKSTFTRTSAVTRKEREARPFAQRFP